MRNVVLKICARLIDEYFAWRVLRTLDRKRRAAGMQPLPVDERRELARKLAQTGVLR